MVDRANYELAHTAPCAETSLEDIYTRFNIDHPKTLRDSFRFDGSASSERTDAAHFVDSVGFGKCRSFYRAEAAYP